MKGGHGTECVFGGLSSSLQQHCILQPHDTAITAVEGYLQARQALIEFAHSRRTRRNEEDGGTAEAEGRWIKQVSIWDFFLFFICMRAQCILIAPRDVSLCSVAVNHSS